MDPQKEINEAINSPQAPSQEPQPQSPSASINDSSTDQQPTPQTSETPTAQPKPISNNPQTPNTITPSSNIQEQAPTLLPTTEQPTRNIPTQSNQQQPTIPSETTSQPDNDPLQNHPIPPTRKPKPFVILLTLLVFISIGVIAYYFLQNQGFINQPTITNYEECVVSKVSKIQESYPAICLTKGGNRFIQPTPAPVSDTTQTDIPSDWETFTTKDQKYSIKYPSDWQITDNSKDVDIYQEGGGTFQHNFTISKGDYSIKFYNPLEWGPNVCLFKDDPRYDDEETFAMTKFATFNEFSSKTSQTLFRRSNVNEEADLDTQWSICTKTSDSEEFTTVSGVGSTTYHTPTDVKIDDLNLITMDRILSTFKFTDQQTQIPEITSLQENDKITSPLTITGNVPPGWMFEGSFQIKITNTQGEVISTTRANQLDGEDWTSDTSTQFSANLSFTTSENSGYIVLSKDNPSGLSQNDQEYKIPVFF